MIEIIEMVDIAICMIMVFLIYMAIKDIYLDIKYDETYPRTKYIMLSIIISINTILHGVMVVPIVVYGLIVFTLLVIDSKNKDEEELEEFEDDDDNEY